MELGKQWTLTVRGKRFLGLRAASGRDPKRQCPANCALHDAIAVHTGLLKNQTTMAVDLNPARLIEQRLRGAPAPPVEPICACEILRSKDIQGNPKSGGQPCV